VEIANADDVVDMHDDPAGVIRKKPNASMVVGLKLLADGDGDAFISAGSTGALLTAATLLNKRIKGIRRAALGAPLPQKNGGFALLMDSGANAECTPEFLLQFAFMGSLYMKTQCGIEQPRVALINNGTEEGKGDPLRHEAYELLKKAHEEGRINFIGNMEGRNVLAGEADVLVCDGFTGNVLMKTIEGTAGFIMKELKEILYANLPSKLAALVLKPGLSKLKNKMDYKNIGGAPMLGVSKPVIKAHGSSDARAFCSAMEQAMLFAHSGFISQVENNVEYMTVPGEKA
jgi:glycerol-3-phosphate acyltransferase PlsX